MIYDSTVQDMILIPVHQVGEGMDDHSVQTCMSFVYDRFFPPLRVSSGMSDFVVLHVIRRSPLAFRGE